MRKIRLLIVDDAVVVRQLVSKVLNEDPQIEVVGTAPNGRIALSKLAQLRPDVITLDVEMPEMGGLETLVELRRIAPQIPVVMFSTMTERGAASTLEALALGAADYVTKPANVGSVAESMQRVRDELLPRIKALCAEAVGLRPERRRGRPASPAPGIAAWGGGQGVDLVVIGASTGGPNALGEILPLLPASFPAPIAIVQHMPPIFTKLLADRLTAKAAIRVHEAREGNALEPGCALVAPGNYHMTLRREGTQVRVRLHQGPLENSCRPAVDVLLRSAAEIYGPRALAVILTGMGQDGLRGCQEIRSSGGGVIVQDEQSSVVWGMPGAVAAAGLAERVLPLRRLADEIGRRVAEGRTVAPATSRCAGSAPGRPAA